MVLHTLLSILSFLLFSHSIPIAMFNVYECDRSICIDITLDIADLEETLKVKYSAFNVDNLEQYINEKTSFLFDDIASEIEIKTISKDSEHIKLKGIFKSNIPISNNIRIKNIVLNNISNQANIIHLNLKNLDVDYHMSKTRQEILVPIK